MIFLNSQGYLKFVVALIQGQLGGYIKISPVTIFFSLAVWIMLLIDTFVFTRETVSHAHTVDALIWVTMQIDSNGKLQMISPNFI